MNDIRLQQTLTHLVEQNTEIMTRLVRLETRMSRLMQHQGLTPYGKPIDPTDSLKEKNDERNG